MQILVFYLKTDNVLKKYSHLNGDLHLLEIEKDTSTSLGLSLAGNKDLGMMSAFVVGIQPDSAVARDGSILIGDELLEVCAV